MIGIFDSWFGWLQTLKYFRDAYPEYEYIFLADQKNYPYWSKNQKEIKKYTFAGLHRLFNQWAQIVIVACNTAAAYAIKERQKTYPEKKALSITIPWIEKVINQAEEYKNIAVLATQGTLNSGIYYSLYHALWWKNNTSLDIIVAPDLVDIVEKWVTDKVFRLKTLAPYIQKIEEAQADCLILWCTHFPVLQKEIKSLYKWDIINPSYEAAKQLKPYLSRHPEISQKLSKKQNTHIFTTWDVKEFKNIGENIMSLTNIQIEKVHIPVERISYASIKQKVSSLFSKKESK